MRGSPVYQVHRLFDETINCIGQSKHQAKEAARQEITRQNRANTWHAVGKKLGVYSYKTADAYRDVWRHAFSYARDNFGIRDITKLTPEAIQSFLQAKLDQGVKHSTFMQYAAALEKLEVALNIYSEKHSLNRTYDFSQAIKAVREIAHSSLERFSFNRAYDNPQKVIDNLTGTARMVARLQYEAGLRVKETALIKESQLKDNNRLEIKGKGGKIRTVELPRDLYNELKNRIENSPDRTFRHNQASYRRELEAAARAAGENPRGKGTHGLRWNFAQEHFQRVLEETGSPTYAMASTSEALGHDRADITAHYLGG